MKKEKFEFGPIQKKWLRLLESGQYKQTTGYLCEIRKGHSVCFFCALGLLADQVLKLPNNYYDDHSFGFTNAVAIRYQGKTASIHKSKEREVGLKPGAGCDVAALNDTGKTFKEIAAIIRTQPERFFDKSI